MKVIGEVMVIGWNIEELFFKVCCLFEIGVYYNEILEFVSVLDDDLIEKVVKV